MLNSEFTEGEVIDEIVSYGTHTVIYFMSGMYTVLEAKVHNGFSYIENCDLLPLEVEIKIGQRNEVNQSQGVM